MLGNGPLGWEEQRSGGAFFSKRSLLPAARGGRAHGDPGSQAVACPRVSVLATQPHVVPVEFLPRYAEAFCWNRTQFGSGLGQRVPLTSHVWRTSHRKQRGTATSR